MAQAITTIHRGPTNHHQARLLVRAGTFRGMTVPWDYELDIDGNHEAAATAFARKMEWLRPGRRLVGGVLPDGAHVFLVIDDAPARLREEAARLAAADEELGRCTEGWATSAQGKVQTTLAVLQRLTAS